MAGGQEMALIQNEYGELYRSDDFAPPKMMKLKGTNIGQIRADEARDMAEAKRRDLPVCEVCGLPFERRSNNQKYCCRACYWKAHAKLKKARLARKEGR